MAGFERHLADELEAIREAGLWRELRQVDSVEANRIKIEGREYLNFSSNDYLGLAGHPALGQAAPTRPPPVSPAKNDPPQTLAKRRLAHLAQPARLVSGMTSATAPGRSLGQARHRRGH